MRCRVELIYDLDCPNVGEARTVLLQAFAQVGISPTWTEWNRKGPDSPAYVRGYGSPTILVNGQDVPAQSRAQEQTAVACTAMARTGSAEFPRWIKSSQP